MQRSDFPRRLTPLRLPPREWQHLAIAPELQPPRLISPGATPERRGSAPRWQADAWASGASGPSSLYSLLAELSMEAKSPKASPSKPTVPLPTGAGEPAASARTISALEPPAERRGRSVRTVSQPMPVPLVRGDFPFSPDFAQSLHKALRNAKRARVHERCPGKARAEPRGAREQASPGSVWASPRSMASSRSSVRSSPRIGDSPSLSATYSPGSVRSAGDCIFPLDLDEGVRSGSRTRH